MNYEKKKKELAKKIAVKSMSPEGRTHFAKTVKRGIARFKGVSHETKE